MSFRYYATHGDRGIIIRAKAADRPKAECFQQPGDWTEVDPQGHLNERGYDALHAGKTVTFTQDDQGYWALNGMIARAKGV